MAKGVMVFGDELRKIREEKFYTQDEFARLVGTGVRNLQRIESSFIAGMGISTFRKLAEVLKASPEGLKSRLVAPPEKVQIFEDEARKSGQAKGFDPRMGEGDRAEDFDSNIEPYSEERIPADIPEFDLPLAAGEWMEVPEACESYASHGLFKVRLRGESMLPVYVDGVVVLFRCLRSDQEGPEIGKDYYVQRSDGTATFKRIAKIDEDTITLHALNKKALPKYLIVPRQEISRMAIAVHKVDTEGMHGSGNGKRRR